MADTPAIMRSLADAVPGPNGGVRFQPIFPDTLREWADEIERLRGALVNCANASDRPAEVERIVIEGLCGPAVESGGVCDCELSHNGLGLMGRLCDCPAGTPRMERT